MSRFRRKKNLLSLSLYKYRSLHLFYLFHFVILFSHTFSVNIQFRPAFFFLSASLSQSLSLSLICRLLYRHRSLLFYYNPPTPTFIFLSLSHSLNWFRSSPNYLLDRLHSKLLSFLDVISNVSHAETRNNTLHSDSSDAAWQRHSHS